MRAFMGRITIMSRTESPNVNLVTNIGFDGEGTHTLSNNGMGNLPSFSILPLRHPRSMEVDTKRDYLCFAKTHSRGWFKDMVSKVYYWMLYDEGIFHRALTTYKRLKSVW